MGYVQFICHDLVGVLTMGNAQIFMQENPMYDRQDRIDPIYGKQQDIRYILRLHHQLSDGKYQDKGDTDSPNVSGEATGMRPEIEPAENQDGQQDDQQEILPNETQSTWAAG